MADCASTSFAATGPPCARDFSPERSISRFFRSPSATRPLPVRSLPVRHRWGVLVPAKSKWAKRAVLSEDGMYNLLHDADQIIAHVKEVFGDK